jgi:hypothetical protein
MADYTEQQFLYSAGRNAETDPFHRSEFGFYQRAGNVKFGPMAAVALRVKWPLPHATLVLLGTQ